jgi:beta-N-acetylhexosaminidase
LVDDSGIRRLALSCLLPGFAGPTPPAWLLSALRDGLGGVILFGSNLGDGSTARIVELTDQLRRAADREIVIGLDEEGGDVTRLDITRGSKYPGAAALGYLDDPGTTKECYFDIGCRLRDAGVTLDLAPVADVNVDPQNPVIGVRSFSADPLVAARQVAAAIQGIQRAGVAACAKHFPGHGATSSDSHHQVATIDRSRADIERVELLPFAAAVSAGSRAVMTGHLMVPALDPAAVATISNPITTGLLRETLAFRGTVVTDALEMRAIADTVGIVEGFVLALIAGADAIEPGAGEYPELIDQIPAAVLAAVRSGRLTLERLTDASIRTAALAGGVVQSATADAAIVVAAAARCIEIEGELPIVRRPLVLECRSPNGVATGELAWSVAEPLASLIPGTEAVYVERDVDPFEMARRADGRCLVAVVRDVGRHAWQHSVVAAATVAARTGDAVIVDVGWPSHIETNASDRRMPVIRTRGISPALLDAAARMLAFPTPDKR